MSNKKFSLVLQSYFEKRKTYPVTLMFKNKQVTDSFLLDLDKTLIEFFNQRNDIELLNSWIAEGEFWSGVLLELNNSEFEDIDSTDFRAIQENKTLNSCLLQIYEEFDECDTRITGFSTGTSVYPVSSLKSLNRNHFSNPNSCI